jgi:hypothetical protein
VLGDRSGVGGVIEMVVTVIVSPLLSRCASV